MTDKEYQCEACDFGKTGAVCALHGVEVERRKDITATMETLKKFMWTMTGLGVLGLLVVTGSYRYSYELHQTAVELNQALSLRQDVARVKIDETNREVAANRADLARTNTAVAVAEDRYNRILIQLDAINRSLVTLTEQKNERVRTN